MDRPAAILRAGILACLLPGALACTEANVFNGGDLQVLDGGSAAPTHYQPVLHRYSIGDVFCTAPSVQHTAPFKILIMLDYSGSMEMNPGGAPGNDPQQLRVDAAKTLVDKYAGDPNVFFGILKFSSGPMEIPGLGKDFTNDPVRLASAFSVLYSNNKDCPPGSNDYSTNYRDALIWAHAAVLADTRKPDHLPETAYGVIFVTDGEPTRPPPPPGSTFADQIRTAITGCGQVLDPKDPPLSTLILWLNTYFINANGGTLAAQQLLQAMATGTSTDPCGPDNWGHGSYFMVTDPQGLVFDIKVPTMRTVFDNQVRSLVLMNYQTRVAYRDGEVFLALDSDGDGLADFQEAASPYDQWSSDRFFFDSNRDGVSDLVHRVTGMPPNRPDGSPAPRPPISQAAQDLGLFVDEGLVSPSQFDQDGDGLTEEEERGLLTNPKSADSDGDGLSNLVEVRFGLNPNDALDAQADPDLDGYPSAEEIATGIDPHHAEPESFREEYAYRLWRGRQFYLDEPSGQGAPVRRTCYEFRIENIPYMAPLRADGTHRDRDVFELNFIDRPLVAKGPSDVVPRRQIVYAIPTRDVSNLYAIVREFPQYW